MSRNYRTGILITGDATKGVRAVKLTQEEIKKLNETQRRGSRYGRDYARSQQSVGTAISNAKVAILAGAVAMTALTKKALSNVDAIDKQAGATGLSTDAWQKYVYAASQSGVSQEKLASGMGALNKRVGELKQGTGSLNTFLKKYDDELYENVKASKSTEEAANLIFEAMGSAETSMDRAALSAAAFSRGAGIEMQNMVAGGADQVERLTQKAEELGLVIDHSIIKKGVEMNDELDTAQRIISTQMTVAFVELAPLITSAAGALAQFTGWLSDMHSKWNAFWEDADLKRYEKEVIDLTAAIEIERIQLANLKEIIPLFDEGSEDQKKYKEQLEETTQEIRVMEMNLKFAEDQIQEYKSGVKGASDETKGATGTFEGLGGAAGESTKKVATLEEKLQKLGVGLKDVSSDMLTLNAGLDANKLGWDEYAEKVFAAEGFTDDVGAATKNLGKTTEETLSEMGASWKTFKDDVQREWGDLFSDTFKKALLDGEASFSDFRDAILEMFIDMIARMAAAWTAEAIFGDGIKSANALFTGANVASSASGSGGLLASAAGGLGKLFGGASTTTGGGFSVPAGVATTTSGGGFSAPAAAGGSSSLLATAGWAAGAVGIGVAISKAFSDARESVASDVADMFAPFPPLVNNSEIAVAGLGDTLGVVMKNGAESSELLKSALKSVNAEFDSGGKGILKITSNAEKARAVTNAWTSEAVSGMNAQVRALMSSAAHTGQYENSAMALRGAIEKVAEEFSNSATEAAGLASAINSIPKEVTTTLTTVRRSVSAGSGNGGGGDSFASGTGGQWYRVPYDGYSPVFHRNELFNVIPSSQASKSATPAGIDSKNLEGLLEASLLVQSRQSEQIRQLTIAVDRMSVDNVTVGRDITQQIRASR